MTYERLLDMTEMSHQRFLFHKIDLSNRLVGLLGARGVGKTTLLLQYLKANPEMRELAFYFSADHMYFNTNTLFEFVESLYLQSGIRHVLIDEVHKYPGWSQTLKNLYDGFPDLFIVFSGSSSLDLVKGSHDLTRRAVLYTLPGLSFREYLTFTDSLENDPVTYDTVIKSPLQLTKTLQAYPKILHDFHSYLRRGFYPFASEETTYFEQLIRVIDKTIFEDIAQFYQLQTKNLRHFGRILNFIATMPPGEVSTYNLAKNLSIDDKTIANYLRILEETGLVRIIRAHSTGNKGLRRPLKVFLNNTNLQYALCSSLGSQVEKGSIRELAFLQATLDSNLAVAYHDKADYVIDEQIFEIGGKNKTDKQIQGLNDAYLVKDDVNHALGKTRPLFIFGFLY